MYCEDKTNALHFFLFKVLKPENAFLRVYMLGSCSVCFGGFFPYYLELVVVCL